jgi:TRAP transporter TAXI family solute receptor
MAKTKNKPRQASGPLGSANKALAVLRAFIDLQDQWGVRELANALDQPISSIHRLLQILRSDGLVDWDAERQLYTLGAEAFRWTAGLGHHFELLEFGRSATLQLSMASGESSSLAVLDKAREQIFIAAASDGPYSLVAREPAGRFQPLGQSPAGWVLLDALSPDRREACLEHKALADRLAIQAVGRSGFAQATLQGRTIIAAAVPGLRQIPQASLALHCGNITVKKSRALGLLVHEHASRLGERLRMRLLSGSVGGASHPGVAAIAGLAREYLPELRLVSRETHGQRNLTALQNGEAAFCTAVADSLEAAFLGLAPFGTPHHRLRVVSHLAPLFLHIVVRADSAVRTFHDLARVRVSPGEKDYATAQTYEVLATLSAGPGRSRARVAKRTAYLNYVEAHREFVDGKIDALVSLNGVPNPAYLRIAAQVPIRLVPLDVDLVARFLAAHPCYTKGEIPARAYRDNGATRTVITSLGLVASAERPDAEVYGVMKAIHEGRDRLRAVAPDFDPRGNPAAPRVSVPLHPGAERYWSEVRSS